MKNSISMKKRFSRPWRILFTVLFVLVFLLITTVGLFWGYYWLWSMHNAAEEKIIDRAFHQEIRQLPQLQITHFLLWEGDSLVDASLQGKGQIRFWYGTDKAPRIDSIADYETSFDCFYINKQGQKTDYAYSTTLDLRKGSGFAKWFPFQVNNLSDLVFRYSDVVAELKLFPHRTDFVDFTDKSGGTRQVLPNSDPRFTLFTKFNDKNVACDLYR
jgi:hypothetical protein